MGVEEAVLIYTQGMLRPAEPAEELKTFVRKYVHLEAETPRLIWPIPARSIGCIEFTFGVPYRIRHVDRPRLEITGPAMLIGAKTHQRIQLELQGHTETFTILFQPTGVQTVFALPGDVLVDEHYDAAAVLGSRVSKLREMLGEAGSFEERVQIANAFFRAMPAPVLKGREMDCLIREMIANEGCIRVEDLAHQAGLSMRQFERRFTTVLGITPKVYARILRFEAALHRKSVTGRNWTTIAHDLEYHDQMHMIHDFESLSGQRPKSLMPHLELLASMAAQSL
jgi:AraC-like DNA-binding protein